MAEIEKEYQIYKAWISTERELTTSMDAGGQVPIDFDIKNNIIELNLYESVEKPYLTGDILLNDDMGLRQTIQINGTERLLIEVGVPGSGVTPFFKRFIITGVSADTKIGNATDVYLFHFVEEHAYFSALKRLSVKYEGTPAQIISSVFTTELNKQVVTGLVQAVNEPMRVLTPYLTPLETVEWVRDRMVSVIGSPYICYSTLRDNSIHLDEFAILIDTPAWNESTPYVYGANLANTATSGASLQREIQRQYFSISSMQNRVNENQLNVAQGGGLGSIFEVLDPLTGDVYSSFHNGHTTISDIISSSFNNTEDQLVLDNKLSFTAMSHGQLTIDNFPTRVFTQISSSAVYDDINGYHDESTDSSKHLLKIKAAAIRTVFAYNMTQITVPGNPYIVNNKAGVGTTIEVEVPIASHRPELVGYLDPNRSGKYGIYNIRHNFKDERHTAFIDIVKLTRRKRALTAQ